MARSFIPITIILGTINLVFAQVLFIPVYQADSQIATAKTPVIPINFDADHSDFDKLDIQESTMNYTEHLKTREAEKITWLDDFGYDESVQDGLIQVQSNTNQVMHDTPNNCGNCECGLRFRYKIVGGVVTKKYEFPWIVVLLYKNKFLCGGSLLNDRYVITAAHCVHGFNHKEYTVRFNEFNRFSENDTKSFTVKISKVIENTQYNPTVINKDVALLKLAKQLNMGLFGVPRPICLPLPTSNFFTGINAVAAGWGNTKHNGTDSGTLLKVTIPIVSPGVCTASYKDIVPITKFMICAGLKKGGKSTCQGDSGGPLMVVQKKRYRLVGVTSFGEGCAPPNFPGVYVRVSEFLPWIMSNTKDACYCTEKTNIVKLEILH